MSTKSSRGTAIVLLLATVALLWFEIPDFLRWIRVQRAIHQIGSESKEEVDQARRRLLAIGTAALPVLLREIGDPGQVHCERLAEVARAIDAAGAVGQIAPRLAGPRAEDRAAAARLLGRLKTEEAVPFLVPRLLDHDATVVSDTVIALAFIGSPKALPALRELLVKGPADARAMAAYGLGMLRDRESISLLERALRDTAENVRFQSERALGAMSRDAEPASSSPENPR